jgi:hypothetical protein
MARGSKQMDILDNVEKLYQEACQKEDRRIDFAECLSNQAIKAVNARHKRVCECLLLFVSKSFQDTQGFAVLDDVLYDVFDPLLKCGHVSSSCEEAFRDLVLVMIGKCSARELVTLFLASLDQALRYGSAP